MGPDQKKSGVKKYINEQEVLPNKAKAAMNLFLMPLASAMPESKGLKITMIKNEKERHQAYNEEGITRNPSNSISVTPICRTTNS
jgi:hypothetical protein